MCGREGGWVCGRGCAGVCGCLFGIVVGGRVGARAGGVMDPCSDSCYLEGDFGTILVKRIDTNPRAGARRADAWRDDE